MTKKTNSADKAEDKDQILWASGYYMTPHRLAMQQMRAVGAWGLGLTFAGLGAYAAIEFATMLPVLVGLVIWALLMTYARSVMRHLAHVEHTLWKLEEQTGADIDGDGYTGRPPEPRTIVIQGEESPFGVDWTGDIVVENTGQSPEFVRRWIIRAGEIGITRSAWVPVDGQRETIAGLKVSKDMWKTMTDWLLQHGWAKNNGKGLRMTRTPGWILRQLDQAEAAAAPPTAAPSQPRDSQPMPPARPLPARRPA